jgi:hypothetical protein
VLLADRRAFAGRERVKEPGAAGSTVRMLAWIESTRLDAGADGIMGTRFLMESEKQIANVVISSPDTGVPCHSVLTVLIDRKSQFT